MGIKRKPLLLSNIKLIRLVFILVVFFEVLSYTSFFYPLINLVVFWLTIFFVFILSIKDLKYGIFFVLAELVIGSKGYLFSFDWNYFTISVRLGIFLAVFLAFIIYIIRKRNFSFLKNKILISYFVLLIFLAWGVISGIIHQHPSIDIFLDANGYLFYGLLPVFLLAINNLAKVKQSLAVIIGAFLAIAVKTIILLFFFSHQVAWIVPSLYRWSRNVQVAEIADLGAGVFRIFFQSHIWALLIFFLFTTILFYLIQKKQFCLKDNYSLMILIYLSSLVIFISYSRSFWLATAAGIVAIFLLLIIKKTPLLITSRLGLLMIANFLLVIGLTFAVVNFPWPKNDAIAFGSLIEERTEDLSEESASVSRFQLLSPLLTEVKSDLLLGSGFGTKVTYQTEDPRFLEMQGTNQYSTYVFEWAYLDTITEIGLLGLIVYLVFLTQIFKKGIETIKQSSNRFIQSTTLGLLAGLFSLTIVHVLTPYLNHPLGIGMIMFGLTILQVFSKSKLQDSAQ